MAYPKYLRERARELRTNKHLSLDEIAERLALPKTTVYYWIKDLPLGRERSVHQRKRSRAMQTKYRLLREAAYARGLAEYDDSSQNRHFAISWSSISPRATSVPGTRRRSRNTASICNSDPAVVSLGARWLKRLSGRTQIVEVQYHLDQDEAELRKFWGETLGIDDAAIRLQPKTNSGHLRVRVWRCAHGVAAIKVHDTYLRARIQAWIDRFHQSWEVD